MFSMYVHKHSYPDKLNITKDYANNADQFTRKTSISKTSFLTKLMWF